MHDLDINHFLSKLSAEDIIIYEYVQKMALHIATYPATKIPDGLRQKLTNDEIILAAMIAICYTYFDEKGLI